MRSYLKLVDVLPEAQTLKKTMFGLQKLKCLRTCKMHLIDKFTRIMNICVWCSNDDRKERHLSADDDRLLKGTGHLKHVGKITLEKAELSVSCPLWKLVCLISLKMTSGVCSLSQLHIYQMSVDVRGRENNSGPLTRSLHARLCCSDTVALLYPETEQWGPCEVSGDFMHSPGPHPNHKHLLWMTYSCPGRLFYFRHNYNRCFTTNKKKKKHQEAEYWHPSVLWQYPWRCTEKQVYNFTFWTQRSLSPLPSVCLELGSYLSEASREPAWIWCIYAFLLPGFCVRSRLHAHVPTWCQIH